MLVGGIFAEKVYCLLFYTIIESTVSSNFLFINWLSLQTQHLKNDNSKQYQVTGFDRFVKGGVIFKKPYGL